MMDALTQAGAFGYLVLGLGAVGLLINLGLLGLGFTGRRVPLFAIAAVPLLTLAFGAVGTWLNSLGAYGLIEGAGNDAASVAFIEMWKAMNVDWLARWTAAGVLAVGAWSAALGALVRPGNDPRWTPVTGALVGFFGFIGLIFLLWWTISRQLGGPGWAMIGIYVLAGSGVLAGALRRATDESIHRVAALRWAASISALLAVWHAGRAMDIGAQIHAFSVDTRIAGAKDLAAAIDLYALQTTPPFALAIMALAGMFLIALNGFYAELPEVAERTTMLEGLGVAALMLFVGFTRIIESNGLSALHEIGTNAPAVHQYDEKGGDLPVSVIVEGETQHITYPANGGYGDVFVVELRPDPNAPPSEEHGHPLWKRIAGMFMDFPELDKPVPPTPQIKTWVRAYAWDGSGWWLDGTPLTEIGEANISVKPPLIAADGHGFAKDLLPALEKARGKAFLLLRGSEVKASILVPPDLTARQVTFLPIALAKTRDLKTELWLDAGDLEVNYGPTTWYGEGDDNLPIPYLMAAVAGTQAKNLNVIALDRRVQDVVSACVPFALDATAKEVNDETVYSFAPAQRTCQITFDDRETLRKEAASLWEIPQPANITTKIEIEGPLQTPEIEDLVGRELGGIAYCADKAIAAGEVLKGDMILTLVMSREGRVYDTLLDEKSKVQVPGVLTCATKRFRKLAFTLPEPPKPEPAPATPDPEPKKEEKKEEEVAPKVVVTLSFKG